MSLASCVRQITFICALLSGVTACNTGSYSPETVASAPVSVFQGSETEVRAFAGTLASALMKKFNPDTGHDPYYLVNSWRYDPGTDMYSIDLTATWAGKPDIFSDECESEVSLVYNVARDGSSFSVGQPRMNGCVQSGQFSDSMWAAFKQCLASYESWLIKRYYSAYIEVR